MILKEVTRATVLFVLLCGLLIGLWHLSPRAKANLLGKAPPVAAGNIQFVASCSSGGLSAASCTVDMTGATLFTVILTNATTFNDSLSSVYSNLSVVSIAGGDGCSTTPPDCLNYAYLTTPASGNVTFTVTSGCSACVIIVTGYKGTIGTVPDGSAGPGEPASVHTTCNNQFAFTPPHPNEIVIFGWATNPSTAGGVVTVSSPFTVREQQNLVAGSHYGGAIADSIQTAPTSVLPTFTSSANLTFSACTIGSFQ